jgi:hypothetical protein
MDSDRTDALRPTLDSGAEVAARAAARLGAGSRRE